MPTSILSKIRAYLYEKLARWCVNKADLAIFTQEEYRQSLLTNSQKQGYIIHASWIDEANIISETDAREIWHNKVSPSTKELKVLFYISYAQESRQYSLWALITVLSSIALLRAMKLKNKVSWSIYTLTLIISFYKIISELLVFY